MHFLGPAGSPHSIWSAVTIRSLWQRRTGPKLPSAHRLAFLSLIACPLAYVMPQAPSSGSCRGCLAISRVSRYCFIWTTLLSTPPLLSNIYSGWKWCLVGSKGRVLRPNSRSVPFSNRRLAIWGTSFRVREWPRTPRRLTLWPTGGALVTSLSCVPFWASPATIGVLSTALPSWRVLCISWWLT